MKQLSGLYTHGSDNLYMPNMEFINPLQCRSHVTVHNYSTLRIQYFNILYKVATRLKQGGKCCKSMVFPRLLQPVRKGLLQGCNNLVQKGCYKVEISVWVGKQKNCKVKLGAGKS